MRDSTVIVFVNKMNGDGKNRFDLLEEIENELKLKLQPMTWPINNGKDFKGVYNLVDKNLVLFTANTRASDEDVVRIEDLGSEVLDQKIGEKDAALLREDVELVDGVYGPLNNADYLSGKISPVFFGSAINNFGVREMLDSFIRIAPLPQCRETTEGTVCPEDEKL